MSSSTVIASAAEVDQNRDSSRSVVFPARKDIAFAYPLR